MKIKTQAGVIDIARVSMSDRESVIALRAIDRILVDASEAHEAGDNTKLMELEDQAFQAAEGILGNLLTEQQFGALYPEELFPICSALKNGPSSLPEHMVPDDGDPPAAGAGTNERPEGNGQPPPAETTQAPPDD